jgi:uncharacterized protein
MLKTAIVKIVDVCARYRWLVIVASLIVSAVSGVYAVDHFAINTDINKLISPDLPWRKRDLAFEAAFPERHELIVGVIDAPTPELAAEASRALAKELENFPTLIKSVSQPGGGEFFERNALLFLPTEELQDVTTKMSEAEPLITVLAGDPTLRGVSDTLSFALKGVEDKQVTLDDMTRTLNVAAETVEKVIAGKPTTFSWRALAANGKSNGRNETRRFVQIRAHLDFHALEPGKAATDLVRKTAEDVGFPTKYGAKLRLTGPVPMADEEFGTVAEGALVNSLATLAVVLLILWFALRSSKIIFAVSVNLFVGLAITAAVGLMMVGQLTLISVAFAVLFVGLGVDFGIQFAVRYRAERYELNDLYKALLAAAEKAGPPLTLAGAATAAGFLSFVPTDYRGVSELGMIAGFGMSIAFFLSISLLPALLMVLDPAGEKGPVGYKSLAPVDRFLDRHRVPVIVGTLLVAVLGSPLLYYLRFDFNPLNLRNAHVESVATLLDLRNNSMTGEFSSNVLTPSLEAAARTADKLAKLPEVARVMTLNFFVPADQERKLALLKELAEALDPGLNANGVMTPPTDAENIAALKKTADDLNKTAGSEQGTGATAAKRLAGAMTQLAAADPAVRATAEKVFTDPLKVVLNDLRGYLKAGPVTVDTLPPDLVREWIARDGRARVEVTPKGNTNDNAVLRNFAEKLLAAEPTAIGGPISILESGDTIVRAFWEAGAWALISITIMLWLTLRRFTDVMLTLVPLLLAGVVTLEICVLIGQPMNFANIIALPLLLGLGVAFKIYFVMAWRQGQTDLLQSSLTHAIFFSALTTATAFGSLWMSSHPGTSSMGKLLALALLCTMAAAILFQPALMGRPRNAEEPAKAARA